MPRSWANYILKLNRSQLRSAFKGRKIRKMEDVVHQQSGGPKLQFKEVSLEELERIKKAIRADLKRERTKTKWAYFLSALIIAMGIFLLFFS